MNGECECVVFDQPCEKCQEAALELSTFRVREKRVQEVIRLQGECDKALAEEDWKLWSSLCGDLESANRELAEWKP